jgi:hypothetical protein
MSEPENFLARWSSRKLAKRTQAGGEDAHGQHRPGNETDAVDNSAVAATPNDGNTSANQSFDPAQLPPLDSIGPDTDIAAFLRRDVPPELTRAALRRAWTSDPAIKNFVGLVESGWDFNDPSAMPGFGPISAEEVARLAGKIIAALPEAVTQDRTQEALTEEKPSQLASGPAPPAAPIEDTPKPRSDSGNDATQQNKTGNKG